MRRLIFLFCLLLTAAETNSASNERLWQLRNLGKAFYENPTTQIEAVGVFKQALDLAPNSPREELNYALALLRAGKTQDGVDELLKVQKQDPSLPHTWFNLGIVYRKNGDFAKAIPEFERMTQLVPGEPVSHYNLGVLYKQAGKMDAARDQFETAARLNPTLAAPHFQLYNTYRQTGHTDEAMKQLKIFTSLKKAQEGAVIAEDMEWSDYAEIYDPIDAKPAETPVDQVRKLTPHENGQIVFDYDADGKPDILAWGAGKLTLKKDETNPIRDAALDAITGVTSAASGDYDNDGYPDLCVLTESGPILLHNEKGKFFKIKANFPASRFDKAVWLDYDHDYDLDLLLLGEKSVLLRNQGTAGFEDHTADFPFASGHAIDATQYRYIADSKAFDLIVSYADHGGILYRDQLMGHYEAVSLPELSEGAHWLRARDVNHDSWLDIVSSAGTVINNQGQFAAVAIPKSDGSVLAFEPAPKSNWLSVQIDGIKNLKLGYNAEVEIKSGALYQKKLYDGAPLLFNIGPRTEADAVRITWPNGLIQNETKQAANKAYRYKEAQRLSGSCPMIWIWDGKDFRFVTDVLGVAPLGASSGDGTFFPTDHNEYIQIPGASLKPVNGKYQVRMSEELSEASYLDQVGLIAVDHPSGTDIFTSERWKGPPFAQFRLYGVQHRIYPQHAAGSHGEDVTSLVTTRDCRYPTDFKHDFSGVAETHTLTLDFGKNAAPDNKAVMILNGWVDWADGSTFLSTAQEGRGGLIPPYLQVKDASGNWKTVIEDMGMPDGKPKTIGINLTGKFLSSSREVRIVTNLCVYWDEIFLGDDAGNPEAKMTRVATSSADVHFRGFSRSVISPTRTQPETFFYDTATPVSLWNPTPGMYTRYGDVKALVEKPDDMFVVMGSGDELRLQFDGASLPALKPGWTRDFLLKVDGWAKDRDANTAHSQSVDPLPFHAMTRYSYPATEHYPDDPAHEAYRREYNTRPALRLIRPLTGDSTPPWNWSAKGGM